LIFIRLFRPLQQEQIRPTNNTGVPKCNCDADAKELTVKKGNLFFGKGIFNRIFSYLDGPNKGRSFFRCGNNDNCNFFAWKDEYVHVLFFCHKINLLFD
jgi:hypothetical protein